MAINLFPSMVRKNNNSALLDVKDKMTHSDLMNLFLTESIEDQISSINPKLFDAQSKSWNLEKLIEFSILKDSNFFEKIYNNNHSKSGKPHLNLLGARKKNLAGEGGAGTEGNLNISQYEIKKIQNISLTILTKENTAINRALFYLDSTKAYLDLVCQAFFKLVKLERKKNTHSGRGNIGGKASDLDADHHDSVFSKNSGNIGDASTNYNFPTDEGIRKYSDCVLGTKNFQATQSEALENEQQNMLEEIYSKYDVNKICQILENWFEREPKIIFEYLLQENILLVQFLVKNSLKSSSNFCSLLVKLQCFIGNINRDSIYSSFLNESLGAIKKTDTPRIPGSSHEIYKDKNISSKSMVLDLLLRKFIEFLGLACDYENYYNFQQIVDIFSAFLRKNYNNLDNKFLLEVMINSPVYKKIILECQKYFIKNYKQPNFDGPSKDQKDQTTVRFIQNSMLSNISKLLFKILEDYTNIIKQFTNLDMTNLDLTKTDFYNFDDTSLTASKSSLPHSLNIQGLRQIFSREIILFYTDLLDHLTLNQTQTQTSENDGKKNLIYELLQIHFIMLRICGGGYQGIVGFGRVFGICGRLLVRWAGSDILIGRVEDFLGGVFFWGQII